MLKSKCSRLLFKNILYYIWYQQNGFHVIWKFKIDAPIHSYLNFAVGAYVPLTDEGNIVVDGILASCYASFDHDLAHIAMTPRKLLPELMELIFGENNGMQGYLSIAKTIGRYVMPNEYLYVSNI